MNDVRIRCWISLCVGVGLGLGTSTGLAADPNGAKQAAKQLSNSTDSMTHRIFEMDHPRRGPEGGHSKLWSCAVMASVWSDRLRYQTIIYQQTVSFVDLDYCKQFLAEIYKELLNLRREARNLPATHQKGLLKDVMGPFHRVDVALYGGNGQYSIPHDRILDE
jgi:hypothetical protein